MTEKYDKLMDKGQMAQLKIQEIEDVNMANQLMISGDYRQPEYSNKRDKYIFIPRVR